MGQGLRMDALRRRQQGLCKAVCEGGDNTVQIGTALNAVGHAGHVNADLRRGETVDGVPLRNVPQILQLLRGGAEGIGGGLFGSDNDCTRGQIVTFLYRAYNK